MKIFIDTANVDEIRETASWGVIDGVTTNPTLISKEGRDFLGVVQEICSIIDGPISAEAMSLKCDEIVAESRKLAKIHKNIVIKIPLINGFEIMPKCLVLLIFTNVSSSACAVT